MQVHATGEPEPIIWYFREYEMSTKTEDMITALQTQVEDLTARVVTLEERAKSSNRSSPSSRTMTDEDAERVLYGDLVETRHKDAAEMLGLSYGQIYSARLGFTFKSVAAKLKAQGVKNRWIS